MQKKRRCIGCGSFVYKTAIDDPYMCRGCEGEYGPEINRYWWLDRV